MIKKIFKTVLVLSLCLGITLPTNAAVSVSDGSAFVTKAEFAADLNNLSNRMAQLENSLDAKIDSLVSSYLTRNGIWNGAKQDFNYNITLNKNMTFSASNSANISSRDTDGYSIFKAYGTGSFSGYPFNTTMSSQTTAYQKYFYGIFYKFITTNKSGLLVFDINVSGSNSNYNELYIRTDSWSTVNPANGLTGMSGLMILSGDEYNPNNSHAKIISNGLSAYNTSSINLYYNTSSNAVFNVNNSDRKGLALFYTYLSFPFGTTQLMGFVEKGEELSLVYFISGFSAFYGTNSWIVGSEGGFSINSMSARIY